MNTVKLGFICLLSMASFLSYAQDIDDDGNVQINPIIVVEPDPELREVYEAQIDSEFFEVGFFAGIISCHRRLLLAG